MKLINVLFFAAVSSLLLAVTLGPWVLHMSGAGGDGAEMGVTSLAGFAAACPLPAPASRSVPAACYIPYAANGERAASPRSSGDPDPGSAPIRCIGIPVCFDEMFRDPWKVDDDPCGWDGGGHAAACSLGASSPAGVSCVLGTKGFRAADFVEFPLPPGQSLNPGTRYAVQVVIVYECRPAPGGVEPLGHAASVQEPAIVTHNKQGGISLPGGRYFDLTGPDGPDEVWLPVEGTLTGEQIAGGGPYPGAMVVFRAAQYTEAGVVIRARVDLVCTAQQ